MIVAKNEFDPTKIPKNAEGISKACDSLVREVDSMSEEFIRLWEGYFSIVRPDPREGLIKVQELGDRCGRFVQILDLLYSELAPAFNVPTQRKLQATTPVSKFSSADWQVLLNTAGIDASERNRLLRSLGLLLTPVVGQGLKVTLTRFIDDSDRPSVSRQFQPHYIRTFQNTLTNYRNASATDTRRPNIVEGFDSLA